MGTFGVVRNEVPAQRRISLREDAGSYRLELDMPEYGRSELHVETVGQDVTVRCVHERDKQSLMPIAVHERLEESFRLPEDADVERLRAVYRNGTLVLTTRRRRLTPRIVAVEPDTLVPPTDKGC